MQVGFSLREKTNPCTGQLVWWRDAEACNLSRAAFSVTTHRWQREQQLRAVLQVRVCSQHQQHHCSDWWCVCCCQIGAVLCHSFKNLIKQYKIFYKPQDRNGIDASSVSWAPALCDTNWRSRAAVPVWRFLSHLADSCPQAQSHC